MGARRGPGPHLLEGKSPRGRKSPTKGMAPNRKSGIKSGEEDAGGRARGKSLPWGMKQGKIHGEASPGRALPCGAGTCPVPSQGAEATASSGHAPASFGGKPAPVSHITPLPHAIAADLMPACSFPGLTPPAQHIPPDPRLGMAQRGRELMDEAGGGAELAPCLPRVPPWITKSPGVLPQITATEGLPHRGPLQHGVCEIRVSRRCC